MPPRPSLAEIPRSLAGQVGGLERDNLEILNSRRAALNVLEDAVQARAAAEALNRQLQQHTAQFETLLNQAPLGVYLLDSGFRILHVNPIARRALGGSPDLVERDFDELLRRQWNPRYALEVLGIFRRTLETGEPYETPEHGEFRPDLQRTEYYEWRVDRIPLPDGQHGLVCYFRDITRQVMARQEIAATAERLRLVNEDLNQFAYAAAHDLREPLRNISTHADLLLRSLPAPLSPESERCRRVVLDGMRRMEALLSGLLAYTQIDSGDAASWVDANAALHQALANLGVKIADSGAVVTSEPLPRLLGQEPHYVQLFQNLIDNAIKYRREEPPRIHLRARAVEQGWEFCVHDNGIGIEREHCDKIFGLFKRLHGNAVPGTGIGLAICSRVVQRYGGRIWVNSEPGRGSEFRFYLPAASDAGPEIREDKDDRRN